jgi:uncharacterized protein
MPPIDGLQVVRSSIHGYGVIALRPIREGEVVVYGDGVVYREDDDFDDEYSLILAGADGDASSPIPLYYDLTDQTRWINHSCTPNTEVDTSWDPKAKRATAWWVALRDIEVGEELSYDYAFSAHLAMPCNCQSRGCRGLIVDVDEIHDVPARLKPYLKVKPTPRRRRA